MKHQINKLFNRNTFKQGEEQSSFTSAMLNGTPKFFQDNIFTDKKLQFIIIYSQSESQEFGRITHFFAINPIVQMNTQRGPEWSN